ncbi:MAG: hypothetical protein U5N86_07375 [Planctomycetota bacterium]|nr:hypothetical protein [Planctomycetota bacterium]
MKSSSSRRSTSLDVQTDKAVRLTARDGNATTVSGRLTLNADGVELIGIRFKKVRLNSYKFVVFRNCEFEQPVNGLGLTVPRYGKVPQHAQLVGCTFHSIDDLCLYSLGFVVGISSCSFYAEGERKSCFELHDSDFAISGSTFKADKRSDS